MCGIEDISVKFRQRRLRCLDIWKGQRGCVGWGGERGWDLGGDSQQEGLWKSAEVIVWWRIWTCWEWRTSGARPADVEGSYHLSNPILDEKMWILNKNDDDDDDDDGLNIIGFWTTEHRVTSLMCFIMQLDWCIELCAVLFKLSPVLHLSWWLPPVSFSHLNR
mgnify:CR=1 FL=1